MDENSLAIVAVMVTQIVSMPIQIFVASNFIQFHKAAINDGTGNLYRVPPKLGHVELANRLQRDLDAIGSVAIAAVITSFLIAAGEADRGQSYLTFLGCLLILPVGLLCAILSIQPETYAKLSIPLWTKRSISISPASYVIIASSSLALWWLN